MKAIIYDHRLVAKALLNKDANPNLKDTNGNSSLHFAVKQNSLGKHKNLKFFFKVTRKLFAALPNLFV